MTGTVIGNGKFGRTDIVGLERRRNRAVGMGNHQRGAGQISGVASRERDVSQVDAVARSEAAECRGGCR